MPGCDGLQLGGFQAGLAAPPLFGYAAIMKTSQLPPGYDFAKWDEASVKRFWDFVAQAQPDSYFTKGAGAILLRHFGVQIRRAETIVDFGCGAGHFLDHICHTGKKFAGCDLSEESIRQVRKKFSDHENFIAAIDGKSLADYKQSFDLAFVLEVVEHLEDEPLAAALRDVHALLKPGGRLIVTTPNEEDLSRNWICCPSTGHIFHRWQHVRSWSAQTLTQTLEAAGFDVETAYGCNVSALGIAPRALAYRLGYWLQGRGQENLFAIARRL